MIVRLGPAAVSMESLYPNRHEKDCLHINAQNTCEFHAGKRSPLHRCTDTYARVNEALGPTRATVIHCGALSLNLMFNNEKKKKA